MPQMNKGGKFIFGESVIRPDGRVQLPPQAVDEYRIASEGRAYLFTGSKITGGFCVTRQGLLLPSKLGHILTDTPSLLYEVPDGTFVPYKGRAYCWTAISASGEITLTEEMMVFLHLKPEMRLILQDGFIRQMQCVICDHCRRHRPAERVFDYGIILAGTED